MIKSYCAITQDEETIIEIPAKNLISYNFGLLDRGDDTDTISWGIYSNRGTLSFVLPQDTSRYFNDNADFRSYKVIFATEDTSFDVGDSYVRTSLGTFYIDDFKYNKQTKVIELELTDRLQEWQEIGVTINIPSMIPKSTYYIQSIYDKVLEQNSGLPYVEFDDGVADALGTTHTTYEYRETSLSFWEFMEEICSLIGGRVSVDAKGVPTLSLGKKQRTVDIKSNLILSIEPTCAKRHNSISSAKIKIPREVEEKIAVTSSFSIDSHITYEKADANDPYSAVNFSYEFQDTPSYRNNKITVMSNAVNANIIHENPYSDREPSNLSWKYPKENTNIKFSGRDNGYISSITIAKPPGDDPYVSMLKGKIVPLDLKIMDEADGTSGSFDFSKLTGLQIFGDIVLDNGDYYEEQKFTEISNGKNIEITISPWGYVSKIAHELSRTYTKLFSKIEAVSEGRTCITLSCVLGNFFLGEELVIPKREPIRKYDVVIPYVKKKDKQVPYMGTEENPMQFLVIGVEYSYKGHFVETLHLQEYVEET